MADKEEERLFKEIDEELRQEQLTKLWQKYGNYVIGAAVLLVVAVAGYQAWHAYDVDRRAERSALFATALRAVNSNKTAEAGAELSKLAQMDSKGYGTLARLDEAALAARAGKPGEAAADYLTIAQDASVAPELRNVALLMSVLHDLDHGDPKALSERIAPLTGAGSPWRHSAKELSALLAQRMGDNKKAAQIFRELADDATAPSGVRARAAEMTAILGS